MGRQQAFAQLQGSPPECDLMTIHAWGERRDAPPRPRPRRRRCQSELRFRQLGRGRHAQSASGAPDRVQRGLEVQRRRTEALRSRNAVILVR